MTDNTQETEKTAEKPTRKKIEAESRLEAQRRWNNRCAVCGSSRMQVHHINGCNWDSMRVENLMPLCANCHLEDVEWKHGIPDWQTLDLADRLCLMQRTENPFLVDYRFTPLWKRMGVLRLLAPSGIVLGELNGKVKDNAKAKLGWSDPEWKELQNRASKFKKFREESLKNRGASQEMLTAYEMKDILAHISTYQRGDFYAARVRSVLIHTESNWNRLKTDTDEKTDAMLNIIEKPSEKRRRMVEDLVSEMLFFQGWDRPKSLNALIP